MARVRNSIVSAAIGCSLLMVVAPTSVADNIVNDVKSGGSLDLQVGASGSVGYWIVSTGNNMDNQTGCNAGDGSPALVSIIAPAPVVADPVSLLFDACKQKDESNEQYVSFRSQVAGEWWISVSVVDAGAGGYHLPPAGFLLRVAAPGPEPSDTSPPIILATLDPAAPDGLDGWYRSDVSLSWSIQDPDSAIDPLSVVGCQPMSLLVDMQLTEFACSAASAGGRASASVSLKRDATPPELHASPSFDPAASGWYNIATGAPLVTFAASDATSGVAFVSGAIQLGPGADQMLDAEAYDHAGNKAILLAGPYSVDLEAPTIFAPSAISGIASSISGGPIAYNASASDDLDPSPVLVCTPASGAMFPLGLSTVECSATDAAGNEADPASIGASVRFNSQGFFQPVRMNKLNIVKAGSTVPLKFSIRAAGGGFIGDLAAVQGFSVRSMACSSALASDPMSMTTSGATVLRYDLSAQQYVQNWKTPNEKGCWRASVSLIDGSEIAAVFQTK